MLDLSVSDIIQDDESKIYESKVSKSTLCFETIPIFKIIILSILTFGIYQVVWCYKNWKILKITSGYKVSPFWRAILAPFTNFELFVIIEKYAKKFNEKPFKAKFLAKWYLTGYFLPIILSPYIIFNSDSITSDPLFSNLGINFFLDLVCFSMPIFIIINIVSYFIIIPILIIIQTKINKINKQNFMNAPKNILCSIGTLGGIFTGMMLASILQMLCFNFIVYFFNPQDAETQYRLGDMYKYGRNKTQNLEQAFQWYEQSAEQDYAPAQCKLAIMYEKGQGISQNIEKAYVWYAKSFIHGYAPAQVKLAMMYEKGQGVTQNFEKACFLYKNIKLLPKFREDVLTETSPFDESPQDILLINIMKKFRRLYKSSQLYQKIYGENTYESPLKQFFSDISQEKESLILCLDEEQKYIKDIYKLKPDESKIVFENSRDRINFWESCYRNDNSLGVRYEEGLGISKNLQIAYDSYQEAASHGSLFAKYMLGVMYEEGKGVTQNLQTACNYYRIVAQDYITYSFDRDFVNELFGNDKNKKEEKRNSSVVPAPNTVVNKEEKRNSSVVPAPNAVVNKEEKRNSSVVPAPNAVVNKNTKENKSNNLDFNVLYRGASVPVVNDTIEYTIEVCNNGTNTDRNIYIKCEFPAEIVPIEAFDHTRKSGTIKDKEVSFGKYRILKQKEKLTFTIKARCVKSGVACMKTYLEASSLGIRTLLEENTIQIYEKKAQAINRTHEEAVEEDEEVDGEEEEWQQDIEEEADEEDEEVVLTPNAVNKEKKRNNAVVPTPKVAVPKAESNNSYNKLYLTIMDNRLNMAAYVGDEVDYYIEVCNNSTSPDRNVFIRCEFSAEIVPIKAVGKSYSGPIRDTIRDIKQGKEVFFETKPVLNQKEKLNFAIRVRCVKPGVACMKTYLYAESLNGSPLLKENTLIINR